MQEEREDDDKKPRDDAEKYFDHCQYKEYSDHVLGGENTGFQQSCQECWKSRTKRLSRTVLLAISNPLVQNLWFWHGWPAMKLADVRLYLVPSTF